MKLTLNRRQFLKRGSALGALATSVVQAPYFLRAKGANGKLNIASVGTADRAGADLRGVASENIVALADVDAKSLEAAAKHFPGAKKYQDYRVMLEKEAEHIDAVVVAPPDHSHAPAAAMALRMGKHVYCEKPLAHTVFEVRTLTRLAREHGCVTQMGTQIHAGENYRRVVELIRAGAIGEVAEVDVWVNVGISYSDGRFTTNTPAPAYLDWDLWLGPAPQRPYSEGVHPFKWRKFWDYGNGRLGDFGCHYIDLVHWALELRHPTKVRARGPKVNAITPPEWLVVHYLYPARGKKPPVRLTWYGGRKPKRLQTLRDADGKPLDWSSGQLFVGTRGMLVSNYSKHLLLPAKAFSGFRPPKPSIPKSLGHHQEWIHAIQHGGTTTCRFDYSGPLAETVLLGNVSYRSGEDIEFDAAHLKITNSTAANHLLHKEYRKGWSL